MIVLDGIEIIMILILVISMKMSIAYHVKVNSHECSKIRAQNSLLKHLLLI